MTRDWNKWASYVVIVAFVFHPCFLSREIEVPDPVERVVTASRLVEFADRVTCQVDVRCRGSSFTFLPYYAFQSIILLYQALALVTDMLCTWLLLDPEKIVFR